MELNSAVFVVTWAALMALTSSFFSITVCLRYFG